MKDFVGFWHYCLSYCAGGEGEEWLKGSFLGLFLGLLILGR
jgi:hypothetical protein